jgi:hypothetical protein
MENNNVKDSGYTEVVQTPIRKSGNYKQGWEDISSEGHRLLHLVDNFRYKTRRNAVMLAIATPLIFFGPFAAQIASLFVSDAVLAAGEGVRYIKNKAESITRTETKKDIAKDTWIVDAKYISSATEIGNKKNAPNSLSSFVFLYKESKSVEALPGWPNSARLESFFDPQNKIPVLSDVVDALTEQAQIMDEGKKITECDFKSKISDSWADGGDVIPKCRYSKDGSRLWVWSYIKAPFVHQKKPGADWYAEGAYGTPFIALLKKEGSAKTKIHIVDPVDLDKPLKNSPGVFGSILAYGEPQKVQGISPRSVYDSLLPGDIVGIDKIKPGKSDRIGNNIYQSRIPRTIAEDFPELIK